MSGKTAAFPRVLISILLALWSCAAFGQEAGTVASLSPSMPIHTSTVPLDAPIPQIDITADKFSQSPQSGLEWDGNVTALGGNEFVMRADTVEGNDLGDIGLAQGNVFLRELDTTFTAQRMLFNETAGFAVFDDASLDFLPYTLQAAQIALLTGQIDAIGATVTTCPPGKHQDYHITAQYIQADLNTHRIVGNNVALYIRGTRVLKINRIHHHYRAGGTSQKRGEKLSQTFGYDAYRGVYTIAGYGINVGRVPISLRTLLPTRGSWSVGASTATTIPLAHHTVSAEPVQGSVIGLVREFASAAGRPLPEGDPLLYHDLLGNDPLESVFNNPVVPEFTPGAAVSLRQPVYGRRIGNLSYSQLPDINGQLDIPIAGNGNLPTDRDPIAMRQVLKKVYLFSTVIVDNGYFQEQPTGAKSSLSSVLATIDTRPILIANNTLFRPRLTSYVADYDSVHEHYEYQQFDLSLQRSFSERSSIGTEYISTFQGGKDPFAFDSVDTAQELDVRGQVGNDHNIFGARLKTDLIRHSEIDWQLVWGFPQQYFVPSISYDHSSGSIGIGFDIEGITY